jgi:hypothetical protein
MPSDLRFAALFAAQGFFALKLLANELGCSGKVAK